jgi:hypothetical protein
MRAEAKVCAYMLVPLSIYRASTVRASRRIGGSRWYIVRSERSTHAGDFETFTVTLATGERGRGGQDEDYEEGLAEYTRAGLSDRTWPGSENIRIRLTYAFSLSRILHPLSCGMVHFPQRLGTFHLLTCLSLSLQSLTWPFLSLGRCVHAAVLQWEWLVAVLPPISLFGHRILERVWWSLFYRLSSVPLYSS